jgi:hypothetical protein
MNGAVLRDGQREIGSLERGKLADLIVLNDNPLADIRNSEKIKYVMVNGRLYDAESMNEIGNREKPRLPFWWQSPTAQRAVCLPVILRRICLVFRMEIRGILDLLFNPISC